MRLSPVIGAVLLTGTLALGTGRTIDPASSWLRVGKPDLQSAGALAFTSDGVLLVGDSRGSAVFALEVREPAGPAAKADTISVRGIDERSPRGNRSCPSLAFRSTTRS